MEIGMVDTYRVQPPDLTPNHLEHLGRAARVLLEENRERGGRLHSCHDEACAGQETPTSGLTHRESSRNSDPVALEMAQGLPLPLSARGGHQRLESLDPLSDEVALHDQRLALRVRGQRDHLSERVRLEDLCPGPSLEPIPLREDSTQTRLRAWK